MIRAADKWAPGYLRSIMRRSGCELSGGTRHLLFCVADHFEPFRGGVSKELALARVQRWHSAYPEVAAEYVDADGRGPQHTFFYPQEEYDRTCVESIAELCKAGCGEVELHLHHRNDTPECLGQKLTEFRDLLHNEHGALGTDRDGQPRFGFVHGNWALCNSRPDGDWCGVDEELSVLKRSGCYADFTFPSAPSPTQPRTVNAIYRANDTLGKPRGHDRGALVRVTPTHLHTHTPKHDDLMLIQGPLALNWRRRKWGVFPRLENAEISEANPPTAARIDLWVRQQVHVLGRPDWVFVKVHMHGCVEKDASMFLRAVKRPTSNGDGGWRRYLHEKYNDGNSWCLHFVTAREMYNIARAAEDGMAGNAGEYREYEIHPPPKL